MPFQAAAGHSQVGSARRARLVDGEHGGRRQLEVLADGQARGGDAGRARAACAEVLVPVAVHEAANHVRLAGVQRLQLVRRVCATPRAWADRACCACH
jgi:hypothetical protein